MDVDEYENEHPVDLFEERLSRVGFNVQSGDYDKFENRCYKIGGKAYADCCASYALRHHGINWGYVDIDFCFFSSTCDVLNVLLWSNTVTLADLRRFMDGAEALSIERTIYTIVRSNLLDYLYVNRNNPHILR